MATAVDMLTMEVLTEAGPPSPSRADLDVQRGRVEQFHRDAVALGPLRWCPPPPGTQVRTAIALFLLTFVGLALLLAGLSQ